MRKMLLIAAAAALLAPAAALAKNKPPHPSQAQNNSKPAPTVLYVLRGTLTPTYSGTTLTTIEINVTSANRDGKTLKGQLLTFTVGPNTKVVLHKHIAIATDDRGMVKVRLAKNSDLAALQGATPKQIIDQGTHAYSGKGGSNAHASTRLYVLRGTLQSYTPSVPGGAVPGPGTIVVSIAKANHDGGVLKNVALPFTVDSSTKVGPAKATWTSGDRVIVKVLGPKTALSQATDLTGTAKQIIDQGQ